MWQVLFTICFSVCALQHVTALSFFSHVFFRMLFPKPRPKLDAEQNKPAAALKRTSSFKDEMTRQMSSNNGPEKMMEQLVFSFIATSREIIPDEFDLPDNIYELPLKGKLFLKAGKVKGIRSYNEPTIDTTVDSEGNMKFVVSFTFRKLEVVYNDMVLDYYGRLFDKKANGKFRVIKNKFIANLRVVKTANVFERITKNKCVIYLTSIKALQLSDISVDIFNEKKRRAFYTSAFVDVIITSLQEMLQQQLSASLSDLLWTSLPDENGFVCRDSGLKELTQMIKNNQGEEKNVNPTTSEPVPDRKPSSSDPSPADQPTSPDNKDKENNTGWFAGLRNWWTKQ